MEAADFLAPRDASAKGSEGDDASHDWQEAQEAQHPIRLLVGAILIVFTVGAVLIIFIGSRGAVKSD